MPKTTTDNRPELKPVNSGAAAIDIGSKMHMAAVNPASVDIPVRTFGTFTSDLHDLADWFKACGVTSVAMESTGVYWIPVYEILEQRGFDVILVNARYAKNVPGRKTDVSDAAWLRQLHSYGLLRGSFRPDTEIATLRAYLRQRERLVEYAAAHIQHMQKALMEMNLQLHHVVSDITGATGMRIIRAIVGGERNPDVLATYRDVRCHSSTETIRAALVGNDREEHVFALTQSLELYDTYQAKMLDCDRKLEVLIAGLSPKTEKPVAKLSRARIKTKQVVNRRSTGALTQFWCSTGHVAPISRACSKSSLARPYIWRLTSLSLVIWPSVCPLDHDVAIAALTAALSLMTPLAKDMTRLARARSNHGSSST
ncbi:transposase [Bradyrhizobium sp. JR1.5]